MAFNGRQRHRVVAMTGELIEPTGTITGGGAKPRSGAMGERPTVRVNEVVMPIEEINGMEQTIDELRHKLRETDDQIRSLTNEIRLV